MNIQFVLPERQIGQMIDIALKEDIGKGDITSEILIPPELQARAILLAKADGILAGIEFVRLILTRVDPELHMRTSIQDGTPLKKGDIIARIRGNARSILKSERVVLNFLQMLSGIATQTGGYVETVSDLPVAILDTRKTTPGFRLLEKYAVRMGGGKNHRLNLSDGVLIKDNHIALCRARGMTLEEIVTTAKEKAPKGIFVEVETTSLTEVKEAVAAGANMIMFDNMTLEQMRKAVKLLPPGVKSEASGGVNMETVRAIAETGVDFISIGALTHSFKALDISLELEFGGKIK